jgi:hypothetical protein
MKNFDNSNMVLFLLFAAVVVVSGCIQNSSTNLNSDFELDYEHSDIDSSGLELYENSMSEIENTTYSVKTDNKMAMNLLVISLSVNMSSEGVFEKDSSEINSSGTLDLGLGDKSNSTTFNTNVKTSENGTVITTDGNRTQTQKYTREKLGVSLEALKDIKVNNASVLGVTQLNGEENILLELEVNSSDLMTNSEHIFEVHSPVQESVEDGQEMNQIKSFNKSKAYLWIDRDSQIPSKFAYYGSANQDALQVRSVTEYSQN